MLLLGTFLVRVFHNFESGEFSSSVLLFPTSTRSLYRNHEKQMIPLMLSPFAVSRTFLCMRVYGGRESVWWMKGQEESVVGGSDGGCGGT